MNIIKSLLVLIFLLTLALCCIWSISKCIKKRQERDLKPMHILVSLFNICVFVLNASWFGAYVYPFEQTVTPILIAEFDVPEKYELEYPGEKFWHGAYEKFGLYAESFYFNPSQGNSLYGFGWPPMDFKKHCYIITYGQRIEKLSYNVWETIDVPIRTGAKVGHMVLDKEFLPQKVYVYQIPKIRIENDINDINSTWD